MKLNKIQEVYNKNIISYDNMYTVHISNINYNT